MATETTKERSAAYSPRPARPGDDRFAGMAAELGREFGSRAAQHDRENSFVHENFDRMREVGYLRLAVPEELGGFGASIRQVCYAQAELAKHCGSTALAVNMHIYLTMANSYRWRHGVESAGGPLRKVAEDGLVLMTSAASDGIWPSASATKAEGGYRVSGRKMFCSQAPVAGVLITAAVYDDPERGPEVLMMSIPTKSEGFEIVETWDTLGMRATSSHDVQLTDVLVTEAQIVGRRPWGKVDAILRTALVHFSPLASSVYYGVAAGARDEAVRTVQGRKRGDGQYLSQDPTVQRQLGLMEQKLRVAWWTLLGALDEMGDDYSPDETTVHAVQVAKRLIMDEAVQIVELAMETAGGSSYFKRSPLERAYRDVRAGKFHPFGTEKSLAYSGRLALGLPVDTIW
jgi:alkylation response protein AidB-like acyl-CoA dehydrogenase